MRQEPQSPWATAMERVRTPWERARRWLASRGAATRVALIVAGLGGVAALGYLATSEQAPGSVAATPLYEGRWLSSDDLLAITAALDAESILYRSDLQPRRVFVRTDRKSAALAAIDKHKASPKTLDDLIREDEPDSPFLTSADHERRRQNIKEQFLKRQIEMLDARITSAQVSIIREKARASLNPRSTVHATVYLQVEGGQKLVPRIVEGIETFVLAALPDLKGDAITVTDQTGRKYMVAGDAPLKEQVRKHSQEEEWSDKIAEGLRHIPGVRVSVTMESISVPQPAPVEPPPAPEAEVVSANGSLHLNLEPRPILAPSLPPVTKTRANVWVRVPRSFYLLAAQSQSPGHHPSPEDMQQMQTTTKRIACEAVDASIPKESQGDVKVAIIQDDLTVSRNVTLPTDTRPDPLWPLPAIAVGGVGLAVAASVVTGFRLATKRPTLRPISPWRAGFVADEPSAGPAERVRELIRLNPEAAAGVLQRWIGQGGAVG